MYPTKIRTPQLHSYRPYTIYDLISIYYNIRMLSGYDFGYLSIPPIRDFVRNYTTTISKFHTSYFIQIYIYIFIYPSSKTHLTG